MGVCTSRNLVLVVAWPALGGQKLHKVVVLVMLSVAAVTAGLHRMLVVLVMLSVAAVAAGLHRMLVVQLLRNHFVCLRVL